MQNAILRLQCGAPKIVKFVSIEYIGTLKGILCGIMVCSYKPNL
jgi:hypothetical protein